MPINDRRYCSTYNKNALGSAWRRRESETLAKRDNTKQKQKKEQPESISVVLASEFELVYGLLCVSCCLFGDPCGVQLIIGGHTTHLREILICCFVFLPEGENGLSCQVFYRKTPCKKHSISDSNETPIYGTWDVRWDDRMHPSAGQISSQGLCILQVQALYSSCSFVFCLELYRFQRLL